MTLDEVQAICEANPYLMCRASVRNGRHMSIPGKPLSAGPVLYLSLHGHNGAGDHLIYPDQMEHWAPADLLRWLDSRLGGLARRGKERFIRMGFDGPSEGPAQTEQGVYLETMRYAQAAGVMDEHNGGAARTGGR